MSTLAVIAFNASQRWLIWFTNSCGVADCTIAVLGTGKWRVVGNSEQPASRSGSASAAAQLDRCTIVIVHLLSSSAHSGTQQRCGCALRASPQRGRGPAR